MNTDKLTASTALVTATCGVLGHTWSRCLPDGYCQRCGVPTREVLAWDGFGQLLGVIPTAKDPR